MEVVAWVSGQDPLREHRCRDNDVGRLSPKDAQPCPPLLVDGCKPADAGGIKDCNQPAALRFRAAGRRWVVPPRRWLSGGTAFADAAHDWAAAIALADGGPCCSSSSSSQASSRAIRAWRSSS